MLDEHDQRLTIDDGEAETPGQLRSIDDWNFKQAIKPRVANIEDSEWLLTQTENALLAFWVGDEMQVR